MTSALDAATEAEVLDRLRAATADRIVLFATHAPAVRARADREITLAAPGTGSAEPGAEAAVPAPDAEDLAPVRNSAREQEPLHG